jgi:very-short-patch-repair endonuclease
MRKGPDRVFTSRSRDLRNHMTKAEIVLWSRIRERKINGFKFRRQHRIFNFIVDFYCHELKFVIEVDGPIHEQPEIASKDRIRDKKLLENGYKVLRLENDEVVFNLEEALAKVKKAINQINSPNLPNDK